MVEIFLRMTQILEKLRIFKFFHILGSFVEFLRYFLALNGLKNSTSIRLSPGGNFEEITAFCCWNWPQKHPKIHETTKSTLFHQLTPIFLQTTNVSEE